MTSVADNLSAISETIKKAARVSGRNPEEISLVAVSKKQPIDKIKAALEAGHRIFGENRVQEAQEHWGALKEKYRNIRLHLIGPLQTNKVKDAVELFDVIETLDREKLARKLAEEMQTQGRRLPCFIQVNTGEEPQKSGVIPREFPDFLKFCRQDCDLNIQGLMCIPPLDDPPALHFALLEKLAGEHGLKELSMGMSGDFEKAIMLGATYIRVGTGVFGTRHL